jgi:tetratricopeptide (TPR) repeat protein
MRRSAAVTIGPPLAALPHNGWSVLQHMLPLLNSSFNDAPCGCTIKFGDAMNIFGSDAVALTDDQHKLLKLCREFTLQPQKHHERPELDITDECVESVLVHVIALGCSELQARVDALPAAAVKLERTSADGLSTRAPLQEDRNFIAREMELGNIGRLVEAVFTSVAPAARSVLLLRGLPGMGKSAAAKQGLRLMQNKYAAASCCQDVHVSSIIRGRGAAAVEEDLVRWGYILGSAIGVGPAASPESVLSLLQAFLTTARYVVLIDDADEAGMQQALKHLPPSRLRCTLLVTSQSLKEKNLRDYLAAAELGVSVGSEIEAYNLPEFTSDECMKLMQSLCPPPPYGTSDKPAYSYAPMYAHDAELRAVFDELVRLPLAVRLFGCWLGDRYRDEMKDAKLKAAVGSTVFDEAVSGAAVFRSLLAEWRIASAGVVLAAGALHSRGLQGTVKLALLILMRTPHAEACSQLISMLALCPPVQTPWSLFDGGGAELMTRGRRVVVKGQPVCFRSVEGKSCRISKLKLDAVVVTDEVKEGGKVTVRLSDGKVINVRGSELLYEGDVKAEQSDGRWMSRLSVSDSQDQSLHQEGRIFWQHDDGSVSVMFQELHQGCHVQLQGLLTRADLNGCFGYVCDAYDIEKQRWPVRVMLPTSVTKDVLMKADCLVCTGQVMAPDGNGSLRAVPAFASGWLTRQRPGAKVLRFRSEDVRGVRADCVLADVTDDLGVVAAAVESSGLVDVDAAGRTLGMHQLLQQAVRAELGNAHDGAMAALLEARCGCMGDGECIDHRMYGVIREILSAAAKVVLEIKSASQFRAVWACNMRLRLLQLCRVVFGDRSLQAVTYRNAVEADMSALDVLKVGYDAVEFRAMKWCSVSIFYRWLGESRHQALISEAEAAVMQAPDAVASWDCKVALATMYSSFAVLYLQGGYYDRAISFSEHALRIRTDTLGEMHPETAATISIMAQLYDQMEQHDRAIELNERALRIELATLGDMHADTASTISSLGVAYAKKGDYDRAIPLYERALHIKTKTLGEMHEGTATVLNSMGTSYSLKRQDDQAIEFYERALHIRMATLGEQKITAETMLNLGPIYFKKGQHDRAIELFERALRIHHATLGPNHQETQSAEKLLAICKSEAAKKSMASRGRQ